MPPKLKTRRKGTESVSGMDAWQCKTCNKTYGNIDDKVMECDKCHELFCTTCINMSDQVYDYMCQPEVIWCCSFCTPKVKLLIEADKNREPDTLRSDLDKTMANLNHMMNDIYKFVAGPRAVNQTEQKPWDVAQQPKVKPLKEIIMEASEEQKREKEDDKRRKKNLIIYKAPESTHQDGHNRKVEDKQLIETFLASVEMGNKTDTSFFQLGRNNDEATTNRPLLVSFDNEKDINEIMKNLNNLKDAKYKIKNLWIGPDRSLKEREEVRRLIKKAKNLNEKEQGDYVHLVRGLQIIRMKKKPPTGLY